MSNPVTATVQIDVRPEVVYQLITDLPTLTSLSEETVAMELRKGDAISKGTVFVGHCDDGTNTEHIHITLQRLKQRAESG
jgi:hypothetical protein